MVFGMDYDFKTVWISDIHLGTRCSNVDILNSFLKSLKCERLYLVGDIIDGWKLNRQFYFPQSHLNTIRRLIKIANSGTKVIYITGNHDEFLRLFTEDFKQIEDPFFVGKNICLKDEDVYETKHGKRLLITHGDLFDSITRYHRSIALLGDIAYDFLLNVNRIFNNTRMRLGFGYWSLSAYIKHKVKKAVNFITDFELAVAHECKRKKCDGVVCGHIHHPEIKYFDNGVVYFNDGDFVESCTALVEHHDGSFEILQFLDGGKVQQTPKSLIKYTFDNEDTNNN